MEDQAFSIAPLILHKFVGTSQIWGPGLDKVSSHCSFITHHA